MIITFLILLLCPCVFGQSVSVWKNCKICADSDENGVCSEIELATESTATGLFSFFKTGTTELATPPLLLSATGQLEPCQNRITLLKPMFSLRAPAGATTLSVASTVISLALAQKADEPVVVSRTRALFDLDSLVDPLHSDLLFLATNEAVNASYPSARKLNGYRRSLARQISATAMVVHLAEFQLAKRDARIPAELKNDDVNAAKPTRDVTMPFVIRALAAIVADDTEWSSTQPIFGTVLYTKVAKRAAVLDTQAPDLVLDYSILVNGTEVSVPELSVVVERVRQVDSALMSASKLPRGGEQAAYSLIAMALSAGAALGDSYTQQSYDVAVRTMSLVDYGSVDLQLIWQRRSMEDPITAGCTDPSAVNYDETADIDDLSCVRTPSCPINLDELSPDLCSSDPKCCADNALLALGMGTDQQAYIIAGVAVGVVVLCCCLLFFIIFPRRRRRTNPQMPTPPIPLVAENLPQPRSPRRKSRSGSVSSRKSSRSRSHSRAKMTVVAPPAKIFVPGSAGHEPTYLYTRHVLNADEFQKQKLLGEGNFGEVWLADWSGIRVAIKEVKGMNNDARAQLITEAQRFQALPPHENVVVFYGVLLHPFSVVLEFCGHGALDESLYGKEKRQFSEDELLEIARGIVCGVAHLHAHSIIHRDLAARNVLLDSNDSPKVSDFGMSRKQTTYNQMTQTAIGPIKWMAPERMSDQIVSFASDIWSLGVVLFELFAQAPPWSAQRNVEVAHSVLQGQSLVPPASTPLAVAETMRLCFSFDPQQRPSAHRLSQILLPRVVKERGRAIVQHYDKPKLYNNNNASDEAAVYNETPKPGVDDSGHYDEAFVPRKQPEGYIMPPSASIVEDQQQPVGYTMPPKMF